MPTTKTYIRESAPTAGMEREITLTCPRFPSTLQKAMDLMIHPDRIEVSSVAAMVEADWEIRDRMLQIANSNYYGLHREVDSPRRMVVLLGPVTVSGMLVAMDLLKLKDSFDAETGRLFLRLMRHSAATAFLARHISDLLRTSPGGEQLVGHQHVGESFATAMIHDLGRIILLFNNPTNAEQLYATLCDNAPSSIDQIREREDEYFGCNHITVGVDFARALRFPEVAIDAIRHHHDARTARHEPTTVDSRMLRSLACAHAAAMSMGFGFPCELTEDDCLSDSSWEDLVKFDLPGEKASEVAQRILNVKAYADEYVTLLIG
jgi:HD-like signal output (HDOD) protein